MRTMQGLRACTQPSKGKGQHTLTSTTSFPLQQDSCWHSPKGICTLVLCVHVCDILTFSCSMHEECVEITPNNLSLSCIVLQWSLWSNCGTNFIMVKLSHHWVICNDKVSIPCLVSDFLVKNEDICPVPLLDDQSMLWPQLSHFCTATSLADSSPLSIWLASVHAGILDSSVTRSSRCRCLS